MIHTISSEFSSPLWTDPSDTFRQFSMCGSATQHNFCLQGEKKLKACYQHFTRGHSQLINRACVVNSYISIVWRCCPFARWKGLVTMCNREMQWGGVMHVGMLAPTCWRSWLLYLCHACGRGLEQQEELHASPAEWKRSEFHSFAVCLLFCAVIMVIKERKALTLHI